MTKPRMNPNIPRLPEASMARLLALLCHPGESSATEIARQFTAVYRLIGSLPLTSAAYCFAHNWLTSAQQLWDAGDFLAAHYQVLAVARKLTL